MIPARVDQVKSINTAVAEPSGSATASSQSHALVTLFPALSSTYQLPSEDCFQNRENDAAAADMLTKAASAAASIAADAKASADVRTNSTGFVPEDIAAKMRAIEAQGDIYDGQQQSASYAPVRKSANYPVVDVYAPVDKVAPAGKSQAVAAVADNSVPAQIDEPYSEDEIENIPAFLRQKNKKYFLD